MRICFFASLLCLMIRHVYHPMISYANAKSGSVSSPQIGTLTALTRPPRPGDELDFFSTPSIETDSMNCVKLHHFVI